MSGKGGRKDRPVKRARRGPSAAERVQDALVHGTVRDVLTALGEMAPWKGRARGFHLYRAAVLQVVGEKRLLAAEIDVLRRRWPTDLDVLGEIAEWHSDRDEPGRVLATVAKCEQILKGRRFRRADAEHIEKLAMLKADAQARSGHIGSARRTLVTGLVRLPESWELAEALSRLNRGRRAWESLFGASRPRRLK